jgi:predicted RNA polymerase sigma factor
MRSEIARRERETAVAAGTENLTSLLVEVEADMDPDDTLILLFMCCHPALSPSSAIGLTLRAVGGLTTAEIANAFLVPEATMAQRITRAKQPLRLLAYHSDSLLRTSGLDDCPQFCTCSI